MFDYVSLGVAAATGQVTFAVNVKPTAAQVRSTARIEFGASRCVVEPPYVALSVIREHLLKVHFLSYQNPIESEISSPIGRDSAGKVVAFLNFFNLAGPLRRKANAEAERERIRLLVEDATIECSVEEKFILVENAGMDVETKKKQIDRLELENELLRLEIAGRIRQAQQDCIDNGFQMSVWDEKSAVQFANNIRLTASVELMREIGLEIRAISVEE